MPKIDGHISSDDLNWRYSVTRDGQDLVLSYTKDQKPDNRRWRLHTSPKWAPYTEFTTIGGDSIRVKPNQWLEAWVNNMWSFVADMDNTGKANHLKDLEKLSDDYAYDDPVIWEFEAGSQSE